MSGQVLAFPARYNPNERWLSKQEIARHYSCTTTTIDTWAREGLPYQQLGRRRKFRVSECDAWLAVRFRDV
jgi:hypothetical protein